MKRRSSAFIPKERVLLNQSALQGIEFTLNALLRDVILKETFTHHLGKAILTEQEINEIGKVFYFISHRDTGKTSSYVNTLTITPKDVPQLIMQLLKYLQRAGYAYQGHIEEFTKANNQLNLTLELIKGLDPSLRVYTFALPLFQAVWIYYFENYEIYE